MEDLKRAFNNGTSPGVYAESLPREQRIDMAKKSLQICIEDETPPKFIVDFLLNLVIFPEVCIDIFSTIQKPLISGYMLIITRKGDELFDSLTIGEQLSARCALNALQICFNCENSELSKNGIMKLAESPTFCVLISSCRAYFAREVNAICEEFKKTFPRISEVPQISMLYQALIVRFKLRTNLITKPELTVSVISSLLRNQSFQSLNTLVENEQAFFLFYIDCVNNFINHPTLEYAFLITNCLVKIYARYKKGIDDPSDKFNRDLTLMLINDINKCKTIPQIPNKIIERITCMQQMPESSEMIFINALKFPALSSEVVINVKNYLTMRESSKKTAALVLERIDDFIQLLLWQNQFLNMLQFCSEILTKNRPRDEFTSILILTLSLFRKAWGFGIKSLREEIQAVIIAIDQQPLRNFLNQVLNPRIQWSYPEIRSSTPFYELLMTINKIYSEVDLNRTDDPLVLLLFGMRSDFSNSVISTITRRIIPPDEIYDILFFQMMIEKGGKPKNYLTAATKPDYDTMLSAKPPSLKDIAPLVIEQIDTLGQPDYLSTTTINKIIITWTAWSDIFGFTDFCQMVFEKLLWRTGHSSIADDVMSFYVAVADAIIILANRSNNSTDSVIDVVIRNIYNINSLAAAEGLAELALIIVWKSGGDWIPRFDRLIGCCAATLRIPQTAPVKHFAISVIKFAMPLSKINERIPDSVIPALVEEGDAKSLMDLFSIKAMTRK